METILVYNQSVSLRELEESTFIHENGRCVKVLGRASDDFRVPLTGKLLQFFQTSRVSVPSMVDLGDSWLGPRIILGFEKFNFVSSFQTGYLRLWGLPFIFHPLSNVDDPFNDHNVSLRVDIEMLTDNVSNCSLKPDVMSHVFELHMGWDLDCEFTEFPPFKAFKNDACVTFKSAKTSNVNDEGDVNSDKLRQNWNRSGSKWKLTMSLSLILTPKSGTERPDPAVSDHLLANKRMRNDETFYDFTIINNMTQVKCHRAMLAAQSPYFARILESGTWEATSGMMEIPLKSAEGVGAMLDYLYTWDIAVLEENPLVCVDLLYAGYKYDIETLQKCTRKILLDKASNWYTPESALWLLFIMKDMEMADLRLKAVNVCKRLYPEIQKLKFYKTLWNRPHIMKQLFEYVLTV